MNNEQTLKIFSTRGLRNIPYKNDTVKHELPRYTHNLKISIANVVLFEKMYLFLLLVERYSMFSLYLFLSLKVSKAT